MEKTPIQIDDFTELYTAMASDALRALEQIAPEVANALGELEREALDNLMENWARQYFDVQED